MSKRNEVVVKDQGWDRIAAEVATMRGHGVKVGITGPETSPEGEDLLTIGLANELGTDIIPARPFVSGAFDAHRRDISNAKERMWRQILMGRLSVSRALGLLGEMHAGHVRDYMTALDTPPNADSTIARKRGGTNPLIDQGHLRRAVQWERY